MRGHSADDMPYDVRYDPYFESAGLLPFVLQFKQARLQDLGAPVQLIKWGLNIFKFSNTLSDQK
jgi:hypothetical protein